MTLKELFSVQADLNKLKSLSLELADLEDFNPYKNNVISDMPCGGESKDVLQWYAEEKERIEQDIEVCKQQLQEDRKRLDSFIESAPYPENDIIRFRVINGMSWEEIGLEVGYSRRNVTRKFHDYIKLPIMPVVPNRSV